MLDTRERSDSPGIESGDNVAGHNPDVPLFDSVVVGGGIAGLTAAYHLHRGGKNVLLLEASDRIGGALKTHRIDGYLVECGPNTVLDTHSEVKELVDSVGLTEERILASERARKRFVVRDGEPVPLPTSPGAFLRTPLFSARAKWRLLGEPFVRRCDPDIEESVASFTRRRLGSEFLDYAIDPFVSGVYAGRPDRLGVREAFPKLADVEERYGSLIIGQVRGAKERRRRKEKSKTSARMFSFVNGLESLPRAIGSHLDDRILTGSQVVYVKPGREAWRVGYKAEDGSEYSVWAKTVAYASGLQSTRPLEGLDLKRNLLEGITYPPLSVVALGFRRADVGHPLDGFGMLVPACEDRYVLGALFCSTLFEGRAPAGHVLITAFVGGARNPELAAASEEELVDRTVYDLGQLLDLSGRPDFRHVTFWPKSIPQYNLGYGKVKDHLRELEKRYPGLVFTGNYLSGISVPETIKSGKTAAKRVEKLLQQRAEAMH